jgi:hypothetical protein
MARIAQALTVMRARAIVQAVFGAVPAGLLGMLSRLGDTRFRSSGSIVLSSRCFPFPSIVSGYRHCCK